MPSANSGLDWFSKSLMEILPAAVYVCAADGVIVAFNDRAAILWGRKPALGQTDEMFCGAHKFFWPDGTFMPHPETPMGWVLRTGEAAHDREAVIERPDGSRISVLVNIAPFFDECGVQIGAVNCFQNLTVQRQAEEERLKLGEVLRQSQKMEAVGQLTGGMAHDFNNLLAGISGNLELMQIRLSQGRVTDIHRYIAAAQSASRRAAALTHRLLSFSRSQTLEVTNINVNILVGEMVDLVRQTVGPAVTVEIVAAPGLWNTVIDANQLENALLNLSINARDAMPKGGRLVIETANIPLKGQEAVALDLPEGEYVLLSVTDNGTGMTAETLARAFEPFFTTKPPGLGTGLGLSMTHAFTRQSGGQAHIVSQPGKGASVSLYLPRTHLIDVVEEPATGLPAMTYVEKSATILVVDDELSVRTMVTEVLQEMGHVVIDASDAEAALRVVLSNVSLDLMITDVGLPSGMNGCQLAKAARDHRPDLKLLIITGYAIDTLPESARLEPNWPVLAKPFTFEALVQRVSDLVLDNGSTDTEAIQTRTGGVLIG